MITPEQKRIFEQAHATALSLIPQIEYLENIAPSIPDIQETVQSLRTRRDYLEQMCSACLAACDQSNDK